MDRAQISDDFMLVKLGLIVLLLITIYEQAQPVPIIDFLAVIVAIGLAVLVISPVRRVTHSEDSGKGENE